MLSTMETPRTTPGHTDAAERRTLSDHLDALRTVSRKILDEHRPLLPAVEYHYTTTNGLLAIIPKKEL
jgi:hypothetical protein